jgi:hypothetical protein
MKLIREDVTKAVVLMSQIIPFFPTGGPALAFIQRAIESFVGTREQLEWLVDAACNTMTQFSLPALRQLFCTRYPAADGRQELPTSAEDAYRIEEGREYERKLAAWKQEAKLLGSGDPEPFEVPADAVKPVSGPSKAPRHGPSIHELEEQLKQQITQGRRTAEETARLLADLEAQVGKKDWLN